MARGLTSSIKTELATGVIDPVLLVEIEFGTPVYLTNAPFDITSSTQKVDTRARARAIALKIENTSSAQDWKLGTFRLDIQADGRR